MSYNFITRLQEYITNPKPNDYVSLPAVSIEDDHSIYIFLKSLECIRSRRGIPFITQIYMHLFLNGKKLCVGYPIILYGNHANIIHSLSHFRI